MPVSCSQQPAGRGPRFFLKVWAGFLVLLVLAFSPAFLRPHPAGAAGEPPKPTPEQLKKVLADFAQYAEQARQAWEVPGMAIAIVRDDRVIFAQGFGVKKAGAKDAVDEHTIFQIGSTSKAFTAALAAILVDGKKFAWQDRVIDHLADFRLFDPWVTREFRVEDLMAQRSGLPTHAGDAQSFLGFDRTQMIHSLRYVKPVTSFRSQFAYQNGLFLAAAALLEKYTGKTWETNVQERLFKPLGMSASSAGLTGLQQAKNAASLHRKKDGRVTALPPDWPYHFWVYLYGPAGGINSNVLDMTKWLRLQLGKGKYQDKQFISEANQEFLQTPKILMGSQFGGMNFYCQGWIYSARHPYPLIWHNGGTSGHKTMVAFVPQAGVGIVVLSNLITNLPEALAFKFYDLYFQNPTKDWAKEMTALEEKVREAQKLPQPPTPPAPPLPLDRYTGAYQNDIYGQAKVSAQKDSLIVTLGPKQVQMTLRPWDRDNFLGAIEGLTQPGEETKAAFKIGGDGRARSLLLDWDGETEFSRLEEKAGQ
ncbi:MAG: serine hydrolase [Thermodesulfobacteriota bacterium]